MSYLTSHAGSSHNQSFLKSLRRAMWVVLWAAALIPALAQTAPLAYVTNSADGTVSVINTATRRVVATIEVGYDPEGIAVSPDGKFVYVTYHGDSISVIDTARRKVVAPIEVGDGPTNTDITDVAFTQPNTPASTNPAQEPP